MPGLVGAEDYDKSNYIYGEAMRVKKDVQYEMQANSEQLLQGFGGVTSHATASGVNTADEWRFMEKVGFGGKKCCSFLLVVQD